MIDVKLFDFCKCKGFYKKAHDGRFISLDKDSLKADLVDINLIGEELEEGIIESDVERAEKTYYEHVEANCKGVVVGFIDLIVEGYLDVIYQDEWEYGSEKFYVTKTAKKTVKCAIVYYANNKKHYVPLNDIERTEQNDNKEDFEKIQ